MSTRTLEQKIARTTLVNNLIGIIAAMGLSFAVCYSFYYDTRHTQADHTVKIEEHTKDIGEIQKANTQREVFEATATVKLNDLKDDVGEIKTMLKRFEDKIDKL